MAQPIACDLCGEEVAVLLQSNLGDGSSMGVGQACLLTFALSSALTFADGIPAEIGSEYRELVAALVTRIAPDLLAPEKPAKAPRKPRATAEANGDVSRETSPSGVRDENPSVAEAAVAGLESRLAASGHESGGDEWLHSTADEHYKSETAEV